MSVKRSIRLDVKLADRVAKLAKEKHFSENAVIENALKHYCDYVYMKEQATVIPQEVIRVFQSSIALMEQRLNNRTNQVLSSLAIEVGTMGQVIAQSLDLNSGDVQKFRKKSVDFIKVNNRVFRLEELID